MHVCLLYYSLPNIIIAFILVKGHCHYKLDSSPKVTCPLLSKSKSLNASIGMASGVQSRDSKERNSLREINLDTGDTEESDLKLIQYQWTPSNPAHPWDLSKCPD